MGTQYRTAQSPSLRAQGMGYHTYNRVGSLEAARNINDGVVTHRYTKDNCPLDIVTIARKYLTGIDAMGIQAGPESAMALATKISLFRQWVTREYDILTGLYLVKVKFVDYEPYLDELDRPSSALMRLYFEETGELEISSLENHSDLLPGQLNLQFRALHDYAHVKGHGSYKFWGELSTACWQFDNQEFPRELSDLLFSEIVAQSATYWYTGHFGECQKLVLGVWTEELRAIGWVR